MTPSKLRHLSSPLSCSAILNAQIDSESVVSVTPAQISVVQADIFSEQQCAESEFSLSHVQCNCMYLGNSTPTPTLLMWRT